MNPNLTATGSRILVILGLVAVGCFVYSFNMSGPLFWDDYDLIINNEAVRAPGQHMAELLFGDMLAGAGLVSNYYRPVQMVSYSINWALGGTAPWGYHLLSNALHIASAVMWYLLLNSLLPRALANSGTDGRRLQSTAQFIAGTAALFWLVHPVQPEAVAYIAGRGDPLAAFFMLASAILWLRATGVMPSQPGSSSRVQLQVFAILAAMLAILSRETAVLLPVYLVAILMVFEHRDRWWASLRKSITQAWPFIALSGVYVLARLTVLDFDNTLNFYSVENIYTESVLVRSWTFLSALTEYLRLTFLPMGLHFEHTVPWRVSPWHWSVITGAAIVLACLAWVVQAWRRGNRLPFLVVTLFFTPFILSSGVLVPINNVFSEHWLYMNLIGAGLLFAVFGIACFRRIREKAGWKIFSWLLPGLFAAYALFLAGSCIARNLVVTEPEQLYREVLAYEPGNVRILNNLAGIHAARGDTDSAEQYWLQAVEADPTQSWHYYNLGNLARDRNNQEQAEAWYLEAISAQPTQQKSYRSLAGILISQSRYQDALEVLSALSDLRPDDPGVYFNIAQACHALGLDERARAALDEGQTYVRSPGELAAFEKLRAQLRP